MLWYGMEFGIEYRNVPVSAWYGNLPVGNGNRLFILSYLLYYCQNHVKDKSGPKFVDSQNVAVPCLRQICETWKSCSERDVMLNRDHRNHENLTTTCNVVEIIY